MSIGHGTKIVRDGLVFAYDMGSPLSWKGKPTTNWAHVQNAIPQYSYAPYLPTSNTTWLSNHPNAIRVYNKDGSEITGYVNSGVTNWETTYHAHWQLDPILKKPVVVMNDPDAQWKAKSWNTGQSFNTLGWVAGDTFSISWLQWTDTANKMANAGMYMRNSSGTWGFHAGQAAAQSTAYNTKIGVWERVYATFTVPTNMNMAENVSIYMYGYYSPRGTVKVADVQLEQGYASGFSPVLTRTSTEAILDVFGKNTITANTLDYASDNTFSFNGGNITIPALHFPNGQTIEIWMKPTVTGSRRNPYNQAYGGYGTWTYESGKQINYYYGDGGGNAAPYIGHTSDFTVEANEIACVATTRDTTVSYWYKNGERRNSYSHSYGVLTSHSTGITIGSGYTGVPFIGDIYSVRLYDRALTQTEMNQNFNAVRQRYGI